MKSARLISVFIITLIFIAGTMILFGDEVLRVYETKDFLKKSDPENNIISENQNDEKAASFSDSETEEGSSSETSEEESCKTQQIQYSLKNFREEISCIETGVNGCIKITANCSVDVYNLDESSGTFGIRYSLSDFSGKELDFKLVEKNVAPDSPEIFSASFIKEDSNGINENLNCPFTMETIPRKENC